MSRWTVTRAEARELARRAERMRREGGVPFAKVEAAMRRDMLKELHRRARAYSGRPRETRELLQLLVIAEAEGVAPGDLASVLGELRAKVDPKTEKKKAA